MRFAALTVLALAVAASALALDAGTASCDITPDVAKYKVPLAGYGAREGKPATGVHDPLFAKVLVLRDGETRVALVTADLRSITPELKNGVIAALEGKGFSRDNVLMCASHTHDGPSFFPEKFWQFQFGEHDPRIVQEMIARIAAAVAEADEKAAPVRVGFAQADIEGFTRNRRWNYDKEARERAGETPCVRPRLWVMRVDGADGACRAVVANFATHPTILGAENMLVSAEWPGVLKNEVEKAFPGATALYTNGAEGDQAPLAEEGADDFERVRLFGERLAREVVALARQVRTQPDLPIAFSRVTPELPEMSFSKAAAEGPYAFLAPSAKEALPRQAEIQVLRIGDTALVGLPGEPLCAVGRAAEEGAKAAGFADAVTIGLANDYIGYLVTAPEYAHGGYEVDQRSYFGPGLGDFLAGHAGNAARRILQPPNPE